MVLAALIFKSVISASWPRQVARSRAASTLQICAPMHVSALFIKGLEVCSNLSTFKAMTHIASFLILPWS